MEAVLLKLLDKVPIMNLGDFCIVVAVYTLFLHIRLTLYIRKNQKE